MEALLEEIGDVQTSYELPKQEFQVDVRFIPTAALVASQPLGLLGQLATTDSFF